MKKMEFDYFNGMEAEQYSFYRIPKMLFTEECFKQLSCEAKVLYGLLLDRMGLSVKNQWMDEKNRVYIIFTVEDIIELLNCGRQKAIRCLAELDTEKGIGLIEKKRLGLGKPNVIYVKNFMQKGSTDQELGHSRKDRGREETERSREAVGSQNLGQNIENGGGQEVNCNTSNADGIEHRYEIGNNSCKVTAGKDSSKSLQKNENNTDKSMKAAFQESVEPKCDELNWWDMECVRREIMQPDFEGHGKQARKTADLSLEKPELDQSEQVQPLDCILSEIPGSESQKYENHTSRSSKIILQEVPESDSREYEKHTYENIVIEKAGESVQKSQKYKNHTSRSSKTILQGVPESYFKKCENHTSESSKTILQEVPKSYSNDTEYSDTDLNDTEKNHTEVSDTNPNDIYTGLCDPIQSYLSYPSSLSGSSSLSAGRRKVLVDMEDKMSRYRDFIRDNIDYHCFEIDRYYNLEDVDELVELMVEVMAMPDDSSLRVAGVERPVSVIKSRFMKINKGHIEYAMGCLQNNTTKIGNIKAYLLTALYNTTLTISSYYRAEVNHDMYGRG